MLVGTRKRPWSWVADARFDSILGVESLATVGEGLRLCSRVAQMQYSGRDSAAPRCGSRSLGQQRKLGEAEPLTAKQLLMRLATISKKRFREFSK